MRKYRSRDFTPNIMASVLLIGFGFCGCLLLVMILAPGDYRGYLLAVGVFLPLCLIPWAGIRRSGSELPGATLGDLWRRFRRRRKTRQSGSAKPLKMWKRRKTTFVPEPWGHERLQRPPRRDTADSKRCEV